MIWLVSYLLQFYYQFQLYVEYFNANTLFNYYKHLNNRANVTRISKGYKIKKKIKSQKINEKLYLFLCSIWQNNEADKNKEKKPLSLHSD